MDTSLIIAVGILAAVSFFLSPKARTSEGFFNGESPTGAPPTLLTLILSQVTTWIFARSLLNAAILGFYYGIWGTLAYAAYYLSFLSGAAIIDAVRFKHGYSSIQGFLKDRFGSTGTSCYNLVIGLRLVSEVFANILVIGILFGAAGSSTYTIAVLAFSGIALAYSMFGGLHASLRTDVMQMFIFILVLALLLFSAASDGLITSEALDFVAFDISSPGPILLIVALLQVWSYPMHDPVMMDRGFLADRKTTQQSFLHAAWISVLCIIGFGILGVVAGANALSGMSMNEALKALLGDNTMFLFNLALIISAMSTLDSTLSSSAKLVVMDMSASAPSLRNGRMVMLLFMGLGLLMVFFGSKDLFSAVAVSGTASMYLAPVIFFCLWGNVKHIATWAYLGSFGTAMAGAILYFLESSGHTQLLGDMHKYTKLLWISAIVLVSGCGLFGLSSLVSQAKPEVTANAS